MTFDEYQKEAEKTSGSRNFSGGFETVWGEKRLMVACLGLTGEAGEVVDEVKKVVAHGHQYDRSKLVKELGDVLWYAAELASSIGVSLDEVATVNVEKLRKRYGDSFSKEASINRTV